MLPERSGGGVALIAAAPGPVKIHCQGRMPDGGDCRLRAPIAERYPDGRVVVVQHGREHEVTATTCPRCGTRREFLNSALNQAGG